MLKLIGRKHMCNSLSFSQLILNYK